MSKRPLNQVELEAAARLSSALAASSESQESVGAKVGVTQGMVWQWANGRLPVPAKRAAALAAALGIEDPGVISPAWRQIASPKNEFVTVPMGAVSDRRASYGDDVTVRFFPKVRASAGYGADNEHSEPLGLRFSSASLRKRGVNPDRCMIIYADGDSMEPDITDGDVVMFDTSATDIKDGRVYVVQVDGRELVKILHRRPGGMVLVQSRNDVYPPYTVSVEQDGFRVLGQVIWTAGWM